jgi:hypothetical protein
VGGEEIAEAIAKASHLNRLRHVTIWADDTGDDGLAVLAGASHLSNLEYLDLGDTENGVSCGITADGVRALAGSKHLERLRHLDLCGNWIEPEGAETLARSKGLPALESLFLVGCGIEERGLLALLRSKTLTGLRELVVDVRSMSDTIARALVAAPLAKQLRRLSLHAWPEDDPPYDRRELFVELFGDDIVETLERGLGQRVEFEIIHWTE